MGEDKKLTIEEEIDNVLSAFDFEEAHKIMVGRNHQWFIGDEMGVPSHYEIIKTARRLLKKAATEKDAFFISTGGFTAVKRKFDDGTAQLLLFYGIFSSGEE